jgi:hypothetical protein
MRLLVVAVGAVALSGCALTMEHPTATLVQQKMDRADCSTKSADGSRVKDCMLAKGYSPSRIPHEEW